MADSVIRWRRSDYTKLGKAVANFNRKISAATKNKNVANIDFLPELKKYKNVKDAITTRREFNRVVNSLSRINKADALDLVFTKSGEELTAWELNETKIQARTRLRQLNKEIEEFQTSNNNLMGNERMAEIKKEMFDIKNLETKKGYDFKKLVENIQRKGTSDWVFKMNIVFKNNYLEALKDYENQPYYDELIKKIKNLNPTEFYNMIKENNLIDFLSADWYRKDKEKFGQLLYNLDIVSDTEYEYLGEITIEE